MAGGQFAGHAGVEAGVFQGAHQVRMGDADAGARPGDHLAEQASERVPVDAGAGTVAVVMGKSFVRNGNEWTRRTVRRVEVSEPLSVSEGQDAADGVAGRVEGADGMHLVADGGEVAGRVVDDQRNDTRL